MDRHNPSSIRDSSRQDNTADEDWVTISDSETPMQLGDRTESEHFMNITELGEILNMLPEQTSFNQYTESILGLRHDSPEEEENNNQYGFGLSDMEQVFGYDVNEEHGIDYEQYASQDPEIIEDPIESDSDSAQRRFISLINRIISHENRTRATRDSVGASEYETQSNEELSYPPMMRDIECFENTHIVPELMGQPYQNDMDASNESQSIMKYIIDSEKRWGDRLDKDGNSKSRRGRIIFNRPRDIER